jgi:Helix-turn-helix domain of resolvase
MSGYVWDLSGTDRQCASYGPGHQIHWIHFNHSMREPSVVIPVAAVVDDDGVVHVSTAKRMKTDGHTAKDIAEYLGVSQATVYRYLAEEPA